MITQIPQLNIAVPEKGDWAQVRTWLDGAGKFEQCRLACLVMVGLHLLDLHKQHGIAAGRPDNSAKLAEFTPWEELIAKETKGFGSKGVGLSETSARRCMAMAREALPRLKKFPALRGINLLNMPISDLDGAQKDALFEGVRKLIDGRSQLDFMTELGLVKAPQGSGATGGGPGGRKNRQERRDGIGHAHDGDAAGPARRKSGTSGVKSPAHVCAGECRRLADVDDEFRAIDEAWQDALARRRRCHRFGAAHPPHRTSRRVVQRAGRRRAAAAPL
jgi:hypothetical protein